MVNEMILMKFPDGSFGCDITELISLYVKDDRLSEKCCMMLDSVREDSKDHIWFMITPVKPKFSKCYGYIKVSKNTKQIADLTFNMIYLRPDVYRLQRYIGYRLCGCEKYF